MLREIDHPQKDSHDMFSVKGRSEVYRVVFCQHKLELSWMRTAFIIHQVSLQSVEAVHFFFFLIVG